jgi:hypothetical protein
VEILGFLAVNVVAVAPHGARVPHLQQVLVRQRIDFRICQVATVSMIWVPCDVMRPAA